MYCKGSNIQRANMEGESGLRVSVVTCRKKISGFIKKLFCLQFFFFSSQAASPAAPLPEGCQGKNGLPG